MGFELSLDCFKYRKLHFVDFDDALLIAIDYMSRGVKVEIVAEETGQILFSNMTDELWVDKDIKFAPSFPGFAPTFED